jgi:hypothetical protein
MEPNTEAQDFARGKYKKETGVEMIRFHSSGRLSRSQFFCRIIAASAILSLFAVSRLATPEQLPTPECLFKTLTSYSCPTCGMTHSFHAISVGHPGMAFHYNWMGPLICLILMFVLLKLSVELLTFKEISIEFPKILPWIAWPLIAGLWLTFWAVRFSHELTQHHAVEAEPSRARLTCGSLAKETLCFRLKNCTNITLIRESEVYSNKRNRVSNHEK